MLPLLISPEQSAFVSGRDASDNVMLAQELVQSIDRRVRGHNMVIKLDMQKAFDRVSWEFLARVLYKFGFSFQFVELILNNFRGAWFSVLVNGSPVGFFQASRGLKQGDPLSPFLFILLLESFSRRLNRQVREGFIQPYILPRGSPLITHLAFADDLILFTRGSRQSLRHLFAFLGDYEAASGQKINKDKSTFLTSKRSSLTQNRVISSLTGLHHSSFPFKYLGCMIFKGRKRVSHFHHLVDKVDARLTGWMSNFLSMAGRLILINHVLAAIPLHVLAALDPPKQILQQIESKFARFFWGTSESQMKRHWCSWDRVARPKAENGLAVRKLEDVALSFACKKWWKLINRSGIWAEFISSRLLSPWHFAVTGRMATVRSIMLQHSRILVLDDLAPSGTKTGPDWGYLWIKFHFSSQHLHLWYFTMFIRMAFGSVLIWIIFFSLKFCLSFSHNIFNIRLEQTN